LSALFAPDGVAAEATPDVAVHVSVRARNADDLAALGDSPTLFLTAKPASYKVPYASRKARLRYAPPTAHIELLLTS
jgi:hypothetical protein